MLSTVPNFTPQAALADDNCTAALYGTSDSVNGSTASSSQTAVEVGVKFTPAFATTATAVRFYRSVADSGGYTVYLRDADGTLLGSGSSSTATGTGWIEIPLDDPVNLTAGTTYISSYHTAHGQAQTSANAYAADESNTMIATPAGAGVYKYDGGTSDPMTGTTSAINPSADTYVTTNNTSTNYGTATELKASNSANRAFLRFDTNNVAPSGTVVTGGTLKLYITTTTGSSGGVQVRPEDDSWTESSATWNNQPTWNSSVYTTSSTPTASSWVTISLPAAAVNSSGNTSLALSYSVANIDNRFASREDSTHKPELTVSYAYDTATLNPSADTYVDSGNASTNNGTANPLWATSDIKRAFLRFATSGTVPSGKVVTGATLKLHVTNNSVTTGGFEVHPEDDSWTETGATWSNQPTWNSTIYQTSSTPTTGSWITLNLPVSAINTIGNTSLGIRYTVANSNAQFSSRESDIFKPELTFTYGDSDPNGSTLIPSADTYVNSNSTGTNYATTTPLASSPSTKRSFLRFNTNGVVPSGKSLASATLKLYVTSMDTAGTGYEVHPETDTWTETGATWSNQPTWNSTVLATSGTPTAGSWLSITLPTSSITTNGNTSLGLRYTVSGSNAYFSSREYVAQAPQLVLTYTPTTSAGTFTSTPDGYYVSPVLTYTDASEPPAPANVTPSVGPNSVTLNWDQALDTQDTAVTPAKSYTIYRGGTQIGTAGSDVTTYNDDGLAKGTYTYTVTATDYCGNTSDVSAGAPATISDDLLFTGSSAPDATVADDPNPTTVGVQFTSSSAGEVRGVQFYRAQAVGDGSSIGVWDSSGNLLGSGDVADTATTGWVTTLLQDPVKVDADTTYTVGYYTPAGNYSYTAQGLYSPITNGNLTAQASGGVLHSGTGMVLGSSTTNDNYYVSPIVGPKQPTGVAEGDIMFGRDGDNPDSTEQKITLRSSDGSLTDLGLTNSTSLSGGLDVSPDGSRVAYVDDWPSTDIPACKPQALTIANSDGSGPAQKTTSTCHGSTWGEDFDPVWAPDGQQIAFTKHSGQADSQNYALTDDYNIAKLNADGSLTQLTSASHGCGTANWSCGADQWACISPSWSPDGTKIAYACATDQTYAYQLYIMDADGSNQHLLAGTSSGYSDYDPVWSPDGSRIYFRSSEVASGSTYGGGIWYYSSTDGFATTTNVTRGSLSGDAFGDQMKISADGNTLVFSDSGYGNLWTVSTSNGTATELDTVGTSPAFVPHDYAFVDGVSTAMTPSGDAVSIDAPKASDAFLRRGIHINLSNSGVDHWEYGWSTSATTAPAGTLQTSSDVSGKTGVLDYSSTSPDTNYYLWVKPHNSSTWNGGGNPLLVHTPDRPIWVAVGDSYSSGHNQPNDEWACPDPTNIGYAALNFIGTCSISGAPHINQNDYPYSWVNGAVNDLNASLPSQWQVIYRNVAISGMSTAKYGVSSTSSGNLRWASGNTQASQLRAALSERADSWNIVSVTGGADDTNWVQQMVWYYLSPGPALDSHEPWATTSSRGNCVDTDSIYSSVTQNARQIRNSLFGIAEAAHRSSPGVRILDVGYPYVHNGSNICFAISTTKPIYGSRAVIDQINSVHKAVTGSSVRYVDLTATEALGSSPVTSGYMQLTRFYGWPHVNSTGQGHVATKAGGVLTGGTW